jgi:hypothetical protein
MGLDLLWRLPVFGLPLRAWLAPLLGAEPHYFFLDEKVTKNQVSKEASLRSGPLPGKKLIKPRAA